ncbi:MAG: IclR family transcriptional regulator [Alphaproteobacteria bacterium]|nr:IclR family transcriptional regulator [Alphaproteobacteria bacterium]
MAGRQQATTAAPTELQSLAPHLGGSIQALERGLKLLAVIAEADGLSLTSLAQRAGIAPSTAHRILATLKASGFVHCDEANGVYLIGVQAFRIGNAFLRNRKLADAGRSAMRTLMEATGETVNMGIEDEGYVVFISQAESHQSVRAFHRPGSRSLLHASSIGKAIMAALPDDAATERLLRTGMPKFTEHTIVDPQALLADLARVRKRGWSVDNEERAEGLRCVGAAVYNEHAEVVGAISISGPVVRMTEERIGELGPMVKRTAAEITARIGGRLPS